MSCPRCHTFVGDPCNSCRTLARAKFLLEGGKLLRTQEAPVLGALRSLAGALSDLAEEAAPILAAELRTSGFPGASSPGRAKPEEDTKEEAEDKRPLSPIKEEDGDAKKVKKTRKKGDGKKPKRTKKDEKKAKKRDRSESNSSRARAADRGEATSSGRRTSAEPSLEGLGLSTLPRGSLGKHFEGRIPAGDRRPAEPAGPPPARYSERAWDGGSSHRSERYNRERSRSKTRRGTKGKQHRERAQVRARNWAQWGRRK